jgi:hypothetical protein
MRIKNITGDLYLRNWFWITCRDMLVIACCLLREWSSLEAFTYLARNWRRTLAKRREIMKRRRVDDDYIATWFRHSPVSKPLPAGVITVVPRYKTAGSSQAEQFEY